jgi:hypothetical protein
MNKNLLHRIDDRLKNGRLIRFAVIDLKGKEIEIARRYCRRPCQTKEYKSLLKKLNRGEIKAIQTGPVNTY